MCGHGDFATFTFQLYSSKTIFSYSFSPLYLITFILLFNYIIKYVSNTYEIYKLFCE